MCHIIIFFIIFILKILASRFFLIILRTDLQMVNPPVECDIYMNPNILNIIFACVIAVLLSRLSFWRRKVAESAFVSALSAHTPEKRDYYCRLAVLAGHKDACKMFYFSNISFFEDYQPLKPFKLHGIKMVFYGHYYPFRYNILLNDEQRKFCQSLYDFKSGDAHGIDFFKGCLSLLNMDDGKYHVMFMPCSNDIKYLQRFKRLNWYICTNRRNLTSGLYDIDIFEPRDSLHSSKGRDNRILKKNYRITRDITDKRIIIVDDVLTTGQSVKDFKAEIERQGGKVVAAVFYGKTVSKPRLTFVRFYVWGSYISREFARLLTPSK